MEAIVKTSKKSCKSCNYYFQHLKNKILNIHPLSLSLIPRLNTYKRAIESGSIIHRASVHIVKKELIKEQLLQGVFLILNNDNMMILKKNFIIGHTV